jgi:hypothetical protein
MSAEDEIKQYINQIENLINYSHRLEDEIVRLNEKADHWQQQYEDLKSAIDED